MLDRDLADVVQERAVFEDLEVARRQAEHPPHPERVARLCQNIQLLFDPEIIVVGGGIGLAPGYLGRVKQALAHLHPPFRPTMVQAALGRDAGVIGMAALAKRAQPKTITVNSNVT